MHRFLHLLVHGFEGIHAELRFFQCELDPRRGMGKLGLGVDGVGGDVRDDLVLLHLEHLLALLGGDLHLALGDDLLRNLSDVVGPEGLLELVLSGSRAFPSVVEDVLYRHVVDEVDLLALFDEIHHLGVQEDLERLPVSLQTGDDRIF